MEGIVLGCVFDPEVTNKEAVHCLSCDMLEETWSESRTDVSMCCKELDKFNICETTGLGKTIHAFVYAYKDMIFLKESVNAVFVNECLREDPYW